VFAIDKRSGKPVAKKDFLRHLLNSLDSASALIDVGNRKLRHWVVEMSIESVLRSPPSHRVHFLCGNRKAVWLTKGGDRRRSVMMKFRKAIGLKNTTISRVQQIIGCIARQNGIFHQGADARPLKIGYGRNRK